MATNHATHGQTATLSKESPSDRGRDARESAQDDSSTVDQNNPPNHGVPTHGPGRFLWECPKDTPVKELGKLYREWQDATEQADLSGWSE